MNQQLSLATDAGSSPFAWSFLFDGTGVGEPLPDPAPSAMVGLEGYIWAHINLTDARARGWINAVEGLPPDAKAMLLGDDEHVRLLGQGSTIWGVFSDFGREPGETSKAFAQIRVVVCDHFVITARRHPIQSAVMTRIAIANGAVYPHPTDLLEALVSNIIAALESAGETVIAAINAIEDRVLDDNIRNDGRKLGPLRREAVSLHRQTTGLQRILARFDDPTGVSEATQKCLRRLLQRLESIHHELHVTLERARLLHEEVGSKLTAETNHQLYILTVISTLMLPPTFVTGIFGMNTKGLLFTESDNAFIYAMLMCLASAIAAYGVLFILGRGRS